MPAFSSFSEADTVRSEVGESSMQMNRAKVFTITITNTANKQNLLNSLNGNSKVWTLPSLKHGTQRL